MSFGEKILNYWDDIMADLEKMVAVPSVAKRQEGEYPFGKDAADAIDLFMDMSKSYGLNAKNVDYYAAHAELGEGEENAVVMAHLDVVPEGEGWESDPYTLTIKDGFAYGRGVSDDKGPAIIALHCLRLLKEEGIVGKRKLRVIVGSGEEIGMEDMPYYFEREQKPTMGFTPDAQYGICNCEKGILNFKVEAKNDSKTINSFVAGTVVNAVPYKAEASVNCSDTEFDILSEAAYKLDGDYVIKKTDFGCEILSKGVASHASMPELGKNAASLLVDLLYSVFGNKIGTMLSFINKKIGMNYHGNNIGVGFEDEPSGKLTFNLGIVNVDEENASFNVDIRHPVTFEGEKIRDIIKTQIEEAGFVWADSHMQEPLYLPADSDFIKLLASSYEAVMKEECEIFSMGGGTYARQMYNNGVAFGPCFTGDVSNIHNCNERIDIEKYKLHAQICLEAMYRMFTA